MHSLNINFKLKSTADKVIFDSFVDPIKFQTLGIETKKIYKITTLILKKLKRIIFQQLYLSNSNMKYPQLVSSRAVNEISDWLIKRLEELDIEHPCVYSRLLLSLLHTPFKLNALDLDEIPQFKVRNELARLTKTLNHSIIIIIVIFTGSETTLSLTK